VISDAVDAEKVAPLPRGRPRSAEADRAIMEATLAILLSDGYAGLTMAGVAQRAGVSTATLYRRFRDRDEVVLSALEDRRAQASPAPDTGNLAGDLEALLLGLVDALGSDRGRLLEGLLSEMMRNPALACVIRRRLPDINKANLVEILDRAHARGEIPEVEHPDLTAGLVIGPLYHGRVISGSPLTAEQVRIMMPMFLAALGYRQPSTSGAAISEQ
jgi:AcrR family transcriptional regulator